MTRSRGVRRRGLQALAAAAAALGVTLAGACARQGAPPGGPEDRRPPVVVRTEPDTFAQVPPDFRGPIRFHFNERISERVGSGSLNDVVTISPATGDVRVSHSRQTLSVELAGGFQRGIVYRVTLQPGVQDLFNNSLVDPFELVFSTGGAYTPTVVAGLVWDRITGEGLEPAEVQAVFQGPDSVVHVARTDTGGVYAFRYLPPGRYLVVAFQDRNRDGIVDPGEPQGSRGILLNNPEDTVANMHIAVLTPDTTPARLTSMELLDSVTLVVEFDDYLDPALPLTTVGAALDPDTAAELEGLDPVPPPAVQAIYHEHEYRAFVEAVSDSFARLDSLDALARAAAAPAGAAAAEDSVAPPIEDSVAAPPEDSVAAQAPEGSPAAVPEEVAPQEVVPRRRPPVALPGRGSADERRRPDRSLPPSRTLVLVLSEGLTPNHPYRLTVTGVQNIANMPQGGGNASVVLSPPPDTAVVDSLGVDTLAVPDTLLAPPDTGGVRLDIGDLLRRLGG